MKKIVLLLALTIGLIMPLVSLATQYDKSWGEIKMTQPQGKSHIKVDIRCYDKSIDRKYDVTKTVTRSEFYGGSSLWGLPHEVLFRRYCY